MWVGRSTANFVEVWQFAWHDLKRVFLLAIMYDIYKPLSSLTA